MELIAVKEYLEKCPRILKNFLIHKQTIEGKSPKTAKEYYFDLSNFLKYIKKKKQKLETDVEDIDIMDIDVEFIKTIDLNDLYDYMMFVSNAKKNKARAMARKVSSLKSFFKYLNVKAKLIDHNPAKELDSPKIVKSLPRYLELNESKQLLNSIDGRNRERDYAIITLFLNCGMRLNELVGINLSHIQGDRLTVLGKGKKERTVYLNEACIEAIAEYLKVRPKTGLADEDALFISSQKRRISDKTVQYLVKKHIREAGLDAAKYSTHKLRHTSATLMYKYGKVDIRALQEILGHENLNTTEIYTHVDSDEIRKAIENNPLAEFKKEK